MFSRGSEWRKWDLHNHTTASDGDMTCEEMLEAAIKNNISCIAITDHHTFENVDRMKKLAQETSVHVISGVEFRTEYGSSSVHMIGLFPDESNGIKLTTDFLYENVLCQLGLSKSTIVEKGKSLEKNKNLSEDHYFKKGWNQVQVDFKEAANLIHKYGGLVTVHAGSKSNSLDEEMKHEGKLEKNVSIENSLGPVKEELFKEGFIDICEVRNQTDNVSFYWKHFHKPSITASDTHKKKDFARNYCWIKADCTFDGLKQILEEPERVSFTEPEQIRRVQENPSKYLKNLNIKKCDGSTISDIWYNNLSIDLNQGLIAIIGNKGSGKSAIADVISLCSNSQSGHWSFLTPQKFRMNKPYNLSKSFEAKLTWWDDSGTNFKTLDSEVDNSEPERVKYIPQNFLEKICTSEDERDFEGEIKKIIFQHLPENEKLGKNSLDEVLQSLSLELASSENDLRNQLGTLNENLVSLEDKQTQSYRETLVKQLNLKRTELDNLNKVKPEPVEKVTSTEPNDEYQSKLKALIENIDRIDGDIEQNRIKLIEKTKDEQTLQNVKDKLDRINQLVQSTLTDVVSDLQKYGIKVEECIKFEYKQEILTEKISLLSGEKQSLAEKLNPNFKNSLIAKKTQKIEEKRLLEQQLDEPARKYQKYCDDLKDWNLKVSQIKGTKDQQNTISYFEDQLKYLDTQLAQDIAEKKANIKSVFENLTGKKKEILAKYTTLYKAVADFIELYKDDLKAYPIQLEASFTFDCVEDRFFEYVNQQTAGSFYGKEQGVSRLKEMQAYTELNNFESLWTFAETLVDALLYDKRDSGKNEKRLIQQQLKKGHSKKELYDYIYGLEYVKPIYQLKLGGKTLSSLSPGERGALLLLFYLFVDMDDRPLIIDQPEENLDNESVYNYLVPFIKKAKKRRQIIIVTHNPNLAVVCDADQIIKMDIDKKNKNEVSFKSGSIENNEINKCIVDVLEGTYPAFQNREKKYHSK